MKVWSLGDAAVDLLPLGNMQYQACAGGAPANVAVGVAKLGNYSGFIGRVGQDPFGLFLEQCLMGEGVSCQALEKDPSHRTSTVVIDLSPAGERNFTFLVSPPADQFLSKSALPEFKEDILHFCSLALVGEQCRETVKQGINNVKQKGGLVSFDINLRAQMWADKILMRQIITEYCYQADILKLSDEELFWLTDNHQNDWQAAIAGLAPFTAKLKIVTLGEKGCIVLQQQTIYHYPAYKVDCIDTTGAGDAFIAGMLCTLAQQSLPETSEQLNQLITNASACGALATTQKGAMTALPNLQQLVAFVKEYGELRYNQ